MRRTLPGTDTDAAHKARPHRLRTILKWTLIALVAYQVATFILPPTSMTYIAHDDTGRTVTHYTAFDPRVVWSWWWYINFQAPEASPTDVTKLCNGQPADEATYPCRSYTFTWFGLPSEYMWVNSSTPYPFETDGSCPAFVVMHGLIPNLYEHVLIQGDPLSNP